MVDNTKYHPLIVYESRADTGLKTVREDSLASSVVRLGSGTSNGLMAIDGFGQPIIGCWKTKTSALIPVGLGRLPLPSPGARTTTFAHRGVGADFKGASLFIVGLIAGDALVTLGLMLIVIRRTRRRLAGGAACLNLNPL